MAVIISGRIVLSENDNAPRGTFLPSAYKYMPTIPDDFLDVKNARDLSELVILAFEGKEDEITSLTNIVIGNFQSNLPEYENDVAAGAGGLTTGEFYKTASGEVRVKI